MREALLGGLPGVGICLGMQLLFESREEGGGPGLGIIEGTVTRLRAKRVPQIGWNTIEGRSDPLFATSGLTTAYYANGFVCRPADSASVTGWSTHEEDRFPATVRVARTLGAQFHPEKSSAPGVRFLRRAIEELAR
jgi:glutamine amidotransferase